MPWGISDASLALDDFPLKKIVQLAGRLPPLRLVAAPHIRLCHPLPHQHSPLGQLTPNTDAVHLIGTQH
jgi:hypothetical protein